MKKVTNIVIVLTTLLLFALMSSCSETLLPTENTNTPISTRTSLSKIILDGVTPCGETKDVDLWAGQTIDAGDVTIYNDGVNLYVTVYSVEGFQVADEQIKMWVGGDLAAMPTGGTPILGQFPYAATIAASEDTYTFEIPLAELGLAEGDCGNIFYIVVHADVIADGEPETAFGGDEDVNVGDSGRWWYYTTFTIQCCGDPPPDPAPSDCETAFAYGDDCFLNIGFNRWGWRNGPLTAGYYSFDLYAGAGQCDITKGDLVGMLTVDYDGSEAIVTYSMNAGFAMDETHLYIGSEPYPTIKKGKKIIETVAPGQYPYKHDLGGATTDIYTVIGLSGEIFVIAHAVVCVDETPPCDEWIIYGSNLNAGTASFDDAIYAYDLKNQTQTPVYDPTPIDGSQNYPNANAYDPVNQRIYFGTDDGRLYYHQIGSGTHVQVEGGTTSGTFGTMACGSWYDGKYYYVQNGTNRLYAVDIVSDVATRTQVGTVPVSVGYGDIAFDPANPGQFIGSGSGKWYWYDLNYNTSATMTESGGDGAHKQLAYGSNGVLYGVNAVDGQFYTIVYDGTTVTLTLDWNSPYTFTDLASGPQCQ